jgi:hypothetical protein
MNKDKVYVHMGSNNFNKTLFRPISNRDYFVKPDGGLWASPVDSTYGWEQWVNDNNWTDKYGEDRFYFRLKENTRLLYIDRAEQLSDLPQCIDPSLSYFYRTFCTLDFEKLAQDYDAIEVSISSDEQLYYDLYGWDVDSLLVMNPDCVEVI